jgi:MoaA/NifB/PqqE/SkfB family radical SAM enzyme
MYKHPLGDRVKSLAAMVSNRLQKRPLSITLELTRRCNARCDYCNHWKEQKQTEQELSDFVAVVQRFQPFAVTICGGEPFMRRDAMEIIEAVKHAEGWRYVAIITNGWFLTDERCRRLVDTGVDQINVSLNWPDARQDEDRQIQGLFKRMSRAVPLLGELGANVQMNSILMNDNLDEAVAIAKVADSWGASVMFTLYSELPGDNHGHLFPKERWPRLREVLAELREQKNVLNAPWYFDMIPGYVEGRPIEGCKAGKETLHVSPGGMIRPCAELPVVSHYSEYDHVAAEPVTCTACFQACRGEVQAPLTPRRMLKLLM